MKTNIDSDIAKKAVGRQAANLVQNGMLVGLGTGSTASFFLESLIERCRTSPLQFQAVATSESTAKKAKAGELSLIDINTITSLDITIDGADEIDHQKQMIKGGGGALLREKIVASISKEMVVIIDEKKLVNQLGAFPLPIEIVPFAHILTLNRIRHLGYQGNMRLTDTKELYRTDNGNYIIDIIFPNKCQNPAKDNAALRSIPGVVEIGFFLGLAGRVLIGHPDGTVTQF